MAAKKTTPIRKPLSVTKTTPTATKSPKVPATNGVAAKTKAIAGRAMSAVATKTNGDAAKLNGHVENGNADNKIIDLSAD